MDIKDQCNLNGISCKDKEGKYLPESELQRKLGSKMKTNGVLMLGGGKTMVQEFKTPVEASVYINDPANEVESTISIIPFPNETKRGSNRVLATYIISDKKYEELEDEARFERDRALLKRFEHNTTGFLSGYTSDGGKPYIDPIEAMMACEKDPNCGGITQHTLDGEQVYTLRRGVEVVAESGSESWIFSKRKKIRDAQKVAHAKAAERKKMEMVGREKLIQGIMDGSMVTEINKMLLSGEVNLEIASGLSGKYYQEDLRKGLLRLTGKPVTIFEGHPSRAVGSAYLAQGARRPANLRGRPYYKGEWDNYLISPFVHYSGSRKPSLLAKWPNNIKDMDVIISGPGVLKLDVSKRLDYADRVKRLETRIRVPKTLSDRKSKMLNDLKLSPDIVNQWFTAIKKRHEEISIYERWHFATSDRRGDHDIRWYLQGIDKRYIICNDDYTSCIDRTGQNRGHSKLRQRIREYERTHN